MAYAHIFAHLSKFSIRDSNGASISGAMLVAQSIPSTPTFTSLNYMSVAACLVATGCFGFQFYKIRILALFKENCLPSTMQCDTLLKSYEDVLNWVDFLILQGKDLETQGCAKSLDTLFAVLREAVISSAIPVAPRVRRACLYLLGLRACGWNVESEERK